MARNEYASADGRERRRLAAENPAKIEEIRYLLAAHRDKKALVFIEYLDQGEAIADALGVPFISGETPHHERAELFRRFREEGTEGGEREGIGADGDDVDTLVVSRVGDEGIDLPNAELAIVASRARRLAPAGLSTTGGPHHATDRLRARVRPRDPRIERGGVRPATDDAPPRAQGDPGSGDERRGVTSSPA